MRKLNNVSTSRMVLALVVTVLVGGSGMALAVGPGPTYVPKSSVLIGATTVPKTTSANYVLRVTFTDNSTADFPPTTGATFSAVFGAMNPTTGAYTATTTFNKDRVSGTFAQNGAQVTSSLTINTP